MSLFAITITMPGRRRGITFGTFACACDAIGQVLTDFPAATSVSASRSRTEYCSSGGKVPMSRPSVLAAKGMRKSSG